MPVGDLLFIGSGPALEPTRLRALILSCGAAPAGAAAEDPLPASPDQLSVAQRAAIRQAHLWDPLPDGYCFNGTQYFDAFGDASLEHPHIDR